MKHFLNDMQEAIILLIIIIHAHNTRDKSLFSLPTAKTNWGKSRSAYMLFNEWNSLNGSLKTSVNFRIFKKQYFNNI